MRTKLFLSQKLIKSICCFSEQINPKGKLGLIAIIAFTICPFFLAFAIFFSNS